MALINPCLRVVSASQVEHIAPEALDAVAMAHATKTVAKVKAGGEAAVLAAAVTFKELDPGESAVVLPEEMLAAFESLGESERSTLQRVGARIKAFAEAQRASLRELTLVIPGGEAGHSLTPVEVAGCYAPGGRYPLPSSVLMTAITAKTAGVAVVVAASPKPPPIILAAAHVAGVDYFLKVGGAHAIAALACGVVHGVPKCDVICGPGSKWVTAAKAVVASSCRVGIDMLAGPSEILVLCDETADAGTVAADLLAQAEHDIVARPIVVAFSSSESAALRVIAAVDAELTKQLSVLPTKDVATVACSRGFAVACSTVEEAIKVSDSIAPEHLEIMCSDSAAISKRCAHYGGLFIGTHAAEVLGDYGIGPNHTLPTGGTARYTGGLSVFAFVRVRTWMRVDSAHAAEGAIKDSITMARLEGLEGHARAAERRLVGNATKRQRQD